MDIASLVNASRLLPVLRLEEIIKFIRISNLARGTLECGMKDRRQPPDLLPFNILLVLSRVMKLDLATTRTCWSLFKDEIWKQSQDQHEPGLPKDVAEYNEHALLNHTSYRHLFPPTRVCQTAGCIKGGSPENSGVKTLTNPLTYKASLYTMKEGVLPIYTTSLYCRSCHTRYYHNYRVHKGSNRRHYYAGIPNTIQVAMHCFMEASLLEFFTMTGVFGWLSSMNFARLYNTCLTNRYSHILRHKLAYLKTFHLYDKSRLRWPFSLDMNDEYLLNGFFLYALLLEKSEQGTTLLLDHGEESQKVRLKAALHERNQRMEGTGQPEYTHACDLCFVVFTGEDGRQYKMQAAVCDGVTIGHPCCAVHDCKHPLVSHRDRYCAEHHDLNAKCAVTDCSAAHEPGFRTCVDAAHRDLENAYFKKGKALFQLRERLKKARASNPVDDPSIQVEEEDEVYVENNVPHCEEKSKEGNRKVKAYFGRRRTHNEQLCMRPCGVILSRATFFGSEAISGVYEFLKATFPTPESTPEYSIFDANCNWDKHLHKIGDSHFQNTARPVDVFHFKCKHKETDVHCQRFCNPAAFPELIKEDGTWRFNSSICEQNNVWVGGYHAILRDMEATRFNFYLDEMIKRRNNYTISQLEAQGHRPWNVPVDLVFPPE